MTSSLGYIRAGAPADPEQVPSWCSGSSAALGDITYTQRAELCNSGVDGMESTAVLVYLERSFQAGGRGADEEVVVR